MNIILIRLSFSHLGDGVFARGEDGCFFFKEKTNKLRCN